MVNPAWTTGRVPEQLVYHSKTLSQNKKVKGYEHKPAVETKEHRKGSRPKCYQGTRYLTLCPKYVPQATETTLPHPTST